MNQSRLILGYFALGSIVTVDTKFGDYSYQGTLLRCDKHLNIHLHQDVIVKNKKTGEQKIIQDCMLKGTLVAGIKMQKEVYEEYKASKDGVIKDIIQSSKSHSSDMFTQKLHQSEEHTLRSKSPEPSMMQQSSINLEEMKTDKVIQSAVKQPNFDSGINLRKTDELSDYTSIQSMDDNEATNLRGVLLDRNIQSLHNKDQQTPFSVASKVDNLTSPGDMSSGLQNLGSNLNTNDKPIDNQSSGLSNLTDQYSIAELQLIAKSSNKPTKRQKICVGTKKAKKNGNLQDCQKLWDQAIEENEKVEKKQGFSMEQMAAPTKVRYGRGSRVVY